MVRLDLSLEESFVFFVVVAVVPALPVPDYVVETHETKYVARHDLVSFTKILVST